jgi:predicted Zn-dependent protease
MNFQGCSISVVAAALLESTCFGATKDAPSAKDAAKMEQMAQEPEIKAEIEREYNNMRREDQDRAYAFNTNAAGKSGALYANPMLQEYVNQLGQSLVPRSSTNLFTFRIVYDPRPESFSLSTGSVYITTGMISMAQNEAQLAFVLGHEIGHIERNHFYNRVRGTILEKRYDEYIAQQSAKRKAEASLLVGLAGAAAGGLARGAHGALIGGIAGLGAGVIGASIYNKVAGDRPVVTEWDEATERDADEFALNTALEQKYDIREAPKLLLAMGEAVTRDPRNGFSFHGSKDNIEPRRDYVQTLITYVPPSPAPPEPKKGKKGKNEPVMETKEPDTLATRLHQSTSLTASSPNFSLLMAALKRDNGRLALDFDLFEMAKSNLEEAEAIRSSDPVTQYYLGKVYRLTARSSEDMQKAEHHFLQAIKYDMNRGYYAEPHLQLAISMIRENKPEMYPEIQKELKTYVTLYQRNNGGALPENMQILYDYLSMTGEDSWQIPRVVNVANAK